MQNTKFVVKVNRGGNRDPEYVHLVDRKSIKMTTLPRLALVMGRLAAEEMVESIRTAHRSPELVSVSVRA
jgi:hypothetical protein